ncbi:UNVERIFIED_CONTAM: hypothetical protein FKN15_058237 [Acipenser sinensis]
MKSCVFLATLLLTVWTAVQAETVTHLNRLLTACQNNGTLPEDDYELDDDELFHIDFDKKEAVPRLPDFAKYWSISEGAAARAETDRQVCIHNVDVLAQCHEYPPEEQAEMDNDESGSEADWVCKDESSSSSDSEEDASEVPGPTATSPEAAASPAVAPAPPGTQEAGNDGTVRNTILVLKLQPPPRVTLYPENDLEKGKPNTLICFITDFHPAAIKVTWTKNTLPVTEGVTLTQYYSNKDFTLNMFSYLSFTPELGDVYSCQVQHSALSETLTTFWEPDVQTESDVGKTAFCAVGLTLGLLGVAVGTFFLIKGNKCN